MGIGIFLQSKFSKNVNVYGYNTNILENFNINDDIDKIIKSIKIIINFYIMKFSIFGPKDCGGSIIVFSMFFTKKYIKLFIDF